MLVHADPMVKGDLRTPMEGIKSGSDSCVFVKTGPLMAEGIKVYLSLQHSRHDVWITPGLNGKTPKRFLLKSYWDARRQAMVPFDEGDQEDESFPPEAWYGVGRRFYPIPNLAPNQLVVSVSPGDVSIDAAFWRAVKIFLTRRVEIRAEREAACWGDFGQELKVYGSCGFCCTSCDAAEERCPRCLGSLTRMTTVCGFPPEPLPRDSGHGGAGRKGGRKGKDIRDVVCYRCGKLGHYQ